MADNWTSIATAGNYAFNDLHAVMAFVGANRPEAIQLVMDAQQAAMQKDDDNAMSTREVGHPLTLAVKAFAEGDYHKTVNMIRPVREIAHRFGGNHAQREVINLTLVEAVRRSGSTNLAAALAAERSARRPERPLSRLFSQRANNLNAAA